jgi:DNA-binding MarR family transcriptional regulator
MSSSTSARDTSAPSDLPGIAELEAELPPSKQQLNDLLWEVTTYAELIGEAALADTPLTLPSSGLLAYIDNEPGITVAEMSRRIPKTQQAISQVAARLEKLGYLERRLGPGRGVGLHATAAGHEMADQARRREAEIETRMSGLLGRERYDQLRRLLIESRAILQENR